MKISCTKENLSQALGLVGGVTSKNVNLPILNNILIKVGEQKVEIAATNLEQAVVVTVRAKIEEPGTFTVPARTLVDYVNLLPEEKIDLEQKENELVVRCGKASTKIKGTSSEDFPIIPTMEEGKGFLVDAEQLRTGLQQVVPAAAKNDIRPELSGIFFGFNTAGYTGLTLAATDSYRLAERKLPLLQGSEELRVIVPARTAQEMMHALASDEVGETSVRLMVSENQIALTYGSVQILSRLIEGQYPDYTQIIPKEFKTTAVLDTSKMSKEMKAAGLFTTTGVNAVTLAFKPVDGVVAVNSTSTQTGEYTSEINAEIEGGENTVSLNNRYVLDGLSNITSGETVFKLISGDNPCILSPKDDGSYVYIVMPIRQ